MDRCLSESRHGDVCFVVGPAFDFATRQLGPSVVAVCHRIYGNDPCNDRQTRRFPHRPGDHVRRGGDGHDPATKIEITIEMKTAVTFANTILGPLRELGGDKKATHRG